MNIMIKKLILIGVIGVSSISLVYYGHNKATAYNTTNLNNNIVFAAESTTSAISKEDLHEKMLNSIDYFKSVEGTYTHINNLSDINQEVSYKIKSSGNKNLSYEKVITKDSDRENIFDGNTLQEYNNKTKKVKEFLEQDQPVNKDDYKASKRYSTNNDGQKKYLLRPDPFNLENSKDSVFSQFIALGYLEDYSKWNITSTEKYLGYEAVTVEGTFNDYYAAKFKANNFKLVVSKDTGILLKLEVNTPSGEIVQFIETTSISINSSIDDSVFKKNKNEYKRIALDEN